MFSPRSRPLPAAPPTPAPALPAAAASLKLAVRSDGDCAMRVSVLAVLGRDGDIMCMVEYRSAHPPGDCCTLSARLERDAWRGVMLARMVEDGGRSASQRVQRCEDECPVLLRCAGALRAG